MKAKLTNFWYYHKNPLLVALIVLAAGGYLLLQQIKADPADYDVAIISADYYSDEQISALQNLLVSAGTDITGDGKIIVTIHCYRLAIGENGQDISEISALDADLVGKVSGLFFLQNPSAFELATNGICRAAEAVSCEDLNGFTEEIWGNLFLSVREGVNEKYAALLKAITA